MKEDGQRDRERADEEEWREEAHAVAWCVVRGA
jgi:cation transport regulator ChaB